MWSFELGGLQKGEQSTDVCFTYSLHCSDHVKDNIPRVMVALLGGPHQEGLFKHGNLNFQLGKYLFKHLFATIEIQITT